MSLVVMFDTLATLLYRDTCRGDDNVPRRFHRILTTSVLHLSVVSAVDKRAFVLSSRSVQPNGGYILSIVRMYVIGASADDEEDDESLAMMHVEAASTFSKLRTAVSRRFHLTLMRLARQRFFSRGFIDPSRLDYFCFGERRPAMNLIGSIRFWLPRTHYQRRCRNFFIKPLTKKNRTRFSVMIAQFELWFVFILQVSQKVLTKARFVTALGSREKNCLSSIFRTAAVENLI